MLIQNAKTMFETERLIERLSLQASLIRYESGHPVKVLDAMAGDWHYVDILYYVINMLYGCEYLKGVDNGRDCLEDALSNISYLYELTSPKHVSFENMAVEDISENFDEYFDIITNFRPNIGSLLLKKELGNLPLGTYKIKITFEQNDLFQLASKTLIGLRGIYEFNKETTLGFSFLNLNQKTLSDKVRIGEEPLNNTIYGVDFKTKHDLPFLTTALDKLFSTSAKSSFDLKGEFAYMDPDPNTKKSISSSTSFKVLTTNKFV